MNKRLVWTLGFAWATVVAALATGTVTFQLQSPQAGQTLSAGDTVSWSLLVSVSTSDNVGLAGFCCDLVQSESNPAMFDIPMADAASIPAEMVGFDRPGGITNPGEGGADSGYIGVQRGTPGAMNLVQIGGAQNTFGQAGTSFGTDPYVEGGIGQSGSQLVVSGSFTAPAAEGTYTFEIANALANVITTLNSPPDYSPVEPATVETAGAAFSFDIGSRCGGDSNCDGYVNFDDINYFVAAVVDEQSWIDLHGGSPSCGYENNDANWDGYVNFDDISPFVDGIVAGGCIPNPNP